MPKIPKTAAPPKLPTPPKPKSKAASFVAGRFHLAPKSMNKLK